MKVCFFTLGCKVNQQETSAMMNIFEKGGYTVVNDEEPADVYVVNSCTVTLSGDRKSIRWIRRAKRMNPDAVVVLCGCMPQAYPQKAIDVEQADIIIGTSGKNNVLDMVNKFFENHERYIHIPQHVKGEKFEEFAGEVDRLHTRAFLKIQDGCSRRCAYCIISYARGPVRSRPVENIVAEARKMAEAGQHEIVLTGVNLSCYGQDLGNNLCDAIEAVARIDAVKRIRLSSLEMDMFTDDMLVRMSKVKKLCPHFHLCLQSGCDKTLKRMGRLYDRQFYTDVMNRMRELFYRPTFTTDVIVGFPGETEEDFLDSLAFVQKCKFVRVHAFPYSQRPGTVAADMPEQLENAVKQSRNRTMIYKSEQTRDRVYAEYIGFEDDALLEAKNAEGYFSAYTSRYIPVLVKDMGYNSGDIVRVRLTGIENGKMSCEAVDTAD